VGAVTRRTVGKLVGIRLADEYRPGLFELRDDRRAAVGDVILEEGGAHRGANALRADQVLDADRYAV
jgi:hypothetical protein